MRCSPIAFYQTGRNNLSGKIPTEIGQLESLEELILSEYEQPIVLTQID